MQYMPDTYTIKTQYIHGVNRIYNSMHAAIETDMDSII